MHRAALGFALMLATLVAAAPALAAPWMRSYVVEWMEPAAYFPGKGSVSDPAPDCPKGAEPALDRRAVLDVPWRSKEELEKILNPDNVMLSRNLGLRGLKGENVYQNLEAVPDRGMRTVEGKVALGFNLDDDKRTGFVSPTGEQGIDNNYYRAWGCWEMFRGPDRKSFGGGYHTDDMRNGKFTILIVMAGDKDPQNDDNVALGLFSSKDKIVKDGNAEVASDYTFRVTDDPANNTVLKATIRNGVLELAAPQTIRWQEPSLITRLNLEKGRARITFAPDGAIQGMIGGYRSIKEAMHTWAINGAGVELASRVDLTAAWYAIKRFADYAPDPKTGQNTAVSTALRFRAVPAFVVKSDGSSLVDHAMLQEGLRAAPTRAAGQGPQTA